MSNFVKEQVWDGTNTAAVKAASTAVATTDPALVVGVSPNTPVQTRPAAPSTGLLTHAIISLSASGSTSLVAAGGGATTIRVMKINLVVAGATNIYFLDSTPTTLSGVYVLTGNGSSFSDDGRGEPLWVGAANKALQINSTLAVSITGDIWYTVT